MCKRRCFRPAPVCNWIRFPQRILNGQGALSNTCLEKVWHCYFLCTFWRKTIQGGAKHSYSPPCMTLIPAPLFQRKASFFILHSTSEKIHVLLGAGPRRRVINPHQRGGYSDSSFARKETFLQYTAGSRNGLETVAGGGYTYKIIKKESQIIEKGFATFQTRQKQRSKL